MEIKNKIRQGPVQDDPTMKIFIQFLSLTCFFFFLATGEITRVPDNELQLASLSSAWSLWEEKVMAQQEQKVCQQPHSRALLLVGSSGAFQEEFLPLLPCCDSAHVSQFHGDTGVGEIVERAQRESPCLSFIPGLD